MKHFVKAILIALLLAGFLSCAGAKIKPGAQNIIESLSITEGENDTTITLTGSEKINYTIFKMTAPPRISVDLANANLEELKDSYEVNNGIISEITVLTEIEGNIPISRLEINLEKLMAFSSSAEGNILTITVSKTEGFIEPPETTEIPEETTFPEGAPEEAGALPLVAPEEGLIMETLPGTEEPLIAPLPVPEETGAEERSIESVIEEAETSPLGEVAALPEELPEMASVEPPLLEEAGVEPAPPPPAPVIPEPLPPPAPVLVTQAPPPSIPPPPPPVEKKAKIQGNKIIPSEKIIFDSNSATIPERYESVLIEIAELMKENPKMRIRIAGHTDSSGAPDFNRALSEYRAIWLKLILERQGISPDRIEVAGLGSDYPIASNDTPSGREKNRRVEFIIIRK